MTTASTRVRTILENILRIFVIKAKTNAVCIHKVVVNRRKYASPKQTRKANIFDGIFAGRGTLECN